MKYLILGSEGQIGKVVVVTGLEILQAEANLEIAYTLKRGGR